MASDKAADEGCGCRADVLKNWRQPSADGKHITGLVLNNSLAGGKVAFIPNSGNTVNWYGCGPTVYDSAHMGHARNYLVFDILRRIMEDYFGYNVNMCMNVTDIDDKIIARAAELEVPFDQLSRYWENDFWKCMGRLGCKLPDVITRVSEYVPKIIAFIERIIANNYGYESDGSVYFDIQAFKSSTTPCQCPPDKCACGPPSNSTGDSSTVVPKHVYGRMEPWSVNDSERVLEGEGALGVTSTKRCPLDFALWKKAKEGEPSWDSPWGKGRPGWHIECSCMASDILGFPLDMHTGGIDLRFPHHDNELAQTEAAFDKPQWVNYFLHAGHLHIHGLKMAKSLKNFITIPAILERHSPRVVRLLVLMHRWDQPMNFNPEQDQSMIEPTKVDKSLCHFFATLKQVHRRTAHYDELWTQVADVDMNHLESINNSQHWDKLDRNLQTTIQAVSDKVHNALLDNFDTPTALDAIMELVTAINVYLKEQAIPKGPLVLKAAVYISRIFKAFGLMDSTAGCFDYEGSVGSGADTRFPKLMDLVGEFRKTVREKSRGMLKKNPTEEPKEVAKSILTVCDELRDNQLPALNILLEDQGEKGFAWKEMAGGRSA